MSQEAPEWLEGHPRIQTIKERVNNARQRLKERVALATEIAEFNNTCSQIVKPLLTEMDMRFKLARSEVGFPRHSEKFMQLDTGRRETEMYAAQATLHGMVLTDEPKWGLRWTPEENKVHGYIQFANIFVKVDRKEGDFFQVLISTDPEQVVHSIEEIDAETLKTDSLSAQELRPLLLEAYDKPAIWYWKIPPISEHQRE